MIAAGEALHCFPPSPALAPFVTVVFVCTGLGRPMCGPMPALDAQISIRLSGHATFEFNDGRSVFPPTPALIGPMSESARLNVGGRFRAVGVSLTAAGWTALFGMPAEDVRDQIVELSALWGDGPVRRMYDALQSARDNEALAWLLDTILCARLATDVYRVDRRLGVIEHWIARSDLGLDELSDRLMLSPRQVARLTLGAYGVGPKLLAMRLRAARAAARIAMNPRAVTDDFGYADQSHMIRDFRRFLGTTPMQFMTGEVSREIFTATEGAEASLTRRDRFAHRPEERV
jgi:AraC-like DNA-binding protein